MLPKFKVNWRTVNSQIRLGLLSLNWKTVRNCGSTIERDTILCHFRDNEEWIFWVKFNWFFMSYVHAEGCDPILPKVGTWMSDYRFTPYWLSTAHNTHNAKNTNNETKLKRRQWLADYCANYRPYMLRARFKINIHDDTLKNVHKICAAQMVLFKRI